MIRTGEGRLLAIYSAGHFLVDLLCAFLVISLLPFSGEDAFLCLLLYNFCAFALQMPIGLIADKLNRNTGVAGAGLVLSLCAFCFSWSPVLASTVAGVGNCLYHVGGGVDVLHFSDKKGWMLGVFVSPGAIGLFIGGYIARLGMIPLHIGFFALFFMSLIILFALFSVYPPTFPSKNLPPSIIPRGRAPILACITLVLVVVLRSYVGMTSIFSWKNGWLSVVSVLALAFGKAAGGFLADKIGTVKTSVLTLILSGVFYLFSYDPFCGIIAIFLFNMTMPLTLFAMSGLFPGARGFAFGTLTFALFLGYIPTLLGVSVPFAGEGWFYSIEALLSMILLVVGLSACKRGENDE